MTLILKADQLTKIYGAERVVNDVSFSLAEKSSTALIGPNGAGKTTTLSMLTGLLKPTTGTISLNGEKNADVRKSIGFLPQYPQFFSWLTALEFTEMAAKLSGLESKHAKIEAQKTLEFVGLGEALKKKTGTFSGGMKQRLGLAQAIVHKPKLLLLDEPVSALDPVGRREIMNLLKNLQQDMTILYSTHILNDAEEMTDQLLFLRKGDLVEQGSLGDVRAKYDSPRYLVEFASEEDALNFAARAPWKVSYKGTLGFIDMTNGVPEMKDLLGYLAGSGLMVRKAERQTASLEEIFLKVAG
ncbi:MAG: ABC transporter ATP-binding protein, partial [Paenisporosarcina sp.]